MQTNVTQNNSEYRDVPVTALTESPSNPRKRFDENSLSELAASFKTQGVLAPLLVRELEESKVYSHLSWCANWKKATMK
jgi:ParB family transcriptional regulator, chromosome partitioning protein